MAGISLSEIDTKGSPQAQSGISGVTLSDLEGAQKTQAKPYDVQPGVASAMNIGQAMTFGFGDEIAGKLGGDRDRYRATVEQFRKDYPGSALLGSVSGGGLIPLGGAKLAAQSPYLAASVIGGLTGLVQGAGDAPEMKDVPRDAVQSGVMGAALGPAFLGSMKNVGAPIASWLGQKVPVVGEKLTNMLAGNRLAQAFQRDNVGLNDVVQNIRTLGPAARVADAAGENTRNTLDLISNMPGRTQNTLEGVIRDRIATRPERMDSIVQTVNNNMGRAGNVEASLIAQKKSASAPLYDIVDRTQIYPTQKLTDVLDRARQLGAFKEAKRLSIADPNSPAFTLDALPTGPVSLREVDHVKRGIDRLIEKETDDVTGKVSSLGRAYRNLKAELVKEADSLATDPNGVSFYKQARDAFAGPAALESAVKQGRRFLNENAEGVKSIMQDMTQSEQEAFRVGAAESLREKFGNQTGQTQFLNAWKNRNIRERLDELMGGSAKYSDVMAILQNESTLKRLESLGPSRNSRTFSREAASEDLNAATAGDLARMGVNAKTGNLPGLMAAWNNVRTRIDTPEPVRNRLGEMMLSQYSPETEQMIRNALANYQNTRGASSSLLGAAAGKSAANMGGLLGF